MLLIAIMWLEYVIAKNTLIGGATVGIVFVGNELMISIRAAVATALRAWDLRFSNISHAVSYFYETEFKIWAGFGQYWKFLQFCTFWNQNRLKHIELWIALIEIAHRVTYIYKDFAWDLRFIVSCIRDNINGRFIRVFVGGRPIICLH